MAKEFTLAFYPLIIKGRKKVMKKLLTLLAAALLLASLSGCAKKSGS